MVRTSQGYAALADISASTLGRAATAAFVLGMSQYGASAETSDNLTTLVSQGGALALVAFQFAVMAGTPLFAARASARPHLVWIVSAPALVAFALLLLNDEVLTLLGLPLGPHTTAAWNLLVLAAPVAAGVGLTVARSHAVQENRFRFLVPFTGPVAGLIVLLVTKSVLFTAATWASAWIADGVILWSAIRRRRPARSGPLTKSVTAVTRSPTPTYGAAVTILSSIITSAIVAAVLNRLGSGLTSAYYGADRVTMGAIGLLMSVVIPRVWAGRLAPERATRSPWWVAAAVAGFIAGSALVAVTPLPEGRLQKLLLLSAALAFGAPSFIGQQLVQARMLSLGRPSVSAAVSMVGLGIVVAAAVVAMLLRDPKWIVVGILASGLAAFTAGSSVRGVRPR